MDKNSNVRSEKVCTLILLIVDLFLKDSSSQRGGHAYFGVYVKEVAQDYVVYLKYASFEQFGQSATTDLQSISVIKKIRISMCLHFTTNSH